MSERKVSCKHSMVHHFFVNHSMKKLWVLKNCIILIYSNKIDLPDSINHHSLAKKLNLSSIKQQWFIQPISAISGTGLTEGLVWIKNNPTIFCEIQITQLYSILFEQYELYLKKN